MAKAKKQQQLNKNLIAFLTALGMVLTIGVVSFAAWRSANRDPEVYAAPAREREKEGAYERAADLYFRAFRASDDRDIRYLLDLSRCYFELGEFGRSFQSLIRANSGAPDNTEVLVTILNNYWRFVDMSGDCPGCWADMRKYSQALLKLDPDNILALVSLSRAIDQLGEKTSEGRDALRRAMELNPNEPRVAVRRVGDLEAEKSRAQRAGAGPAVMSEFDQQIQEAAARLEEASREHPGDPVLTGSYVRFLVREQQYDKAESVLDRAVAANPDNPVLQYQRGLLLQARMEDRRDQMTPAEFDEMKARAARHAERAIELEPAMFEAMICRGELELVRRPGQERPDLEDYARALALFREYVHSTRLLKSVRALVMMPSRLQLVMQGFQASLSMFALAPEETRATHLAAAEYFLNDANTRFPDRAFTHYMRGQLDLAREDIRGAINAFQRALELQPKPNFWVSQFNLPLTEQLAVLYFQIRQYGEAERYARRAREDFRELGLELPLRFRMREVDLLVQLNRHQEAYDQANEVLAIGRASLTPEDRARLLQQRVYCLKQLGREAEVKAVIAEQPAAAQETVRGRMVSARIAAAERDLDTAARLLESILSDPQARKPDLADSLSLYAAVMSDANRREEGVRFLRQLEAQADTDDYKRAIRGFTVVLSEVDPEKRAVVLEQHLKTEPDELTRYSNLVVYYSQRGELEKAAEALDRKEQLQPGDPETTQQQFYLALKRKRFDRASSYLAALRDKNVDGAGGATYRAELALAQGRPEEALRELNYAISVLPRSSELHTASARAYIDMNRRDEAIQQLEMAVQINPRDFIAQRSLFVLYDQIASRTIGAEKEKYLQRRNEYMAAAAALPESERDKDFQGRRQFLEEESNPRQAIDSREQRRREDPKDVANLIRLGQLYAKLWEEAHEGNRDLAPQLAVKATECFEAAMALEPGNSELLQIGAGFYGWYADRARGERLVQNYLNAVTGPARIYGTLIKAIMYEQLLDFPAAEQAFRDAQALVREVIKDGPDAVRRSEIQVGFEALQYYQRRKLPEQVVETSRWVLERLDPKKDSEVYSIQQARLMLVDGLLKSRQMAAAEKEVAEFQRLFPNDPRGRIALASLHLNQNKRDLAYEDLTAILRDQPDNVWALHNRGVVNLQRTRYTEAKVDLERARVLIDREPRLELPLRSRLAILYEAINQPDLAERELVQMLQLLDRQAASSEVKDACVERMLRLYVRNNRLEDAQRVISGYMEQRPNDPIWPYYFGRVNEDRAQRAQFEADQARQSGNTALANTKTAESRSYYATAARYHRVALEREAVSPDPRLYSLAMNAQISALAKAGRPADGVTIYERAPAERMTPFIRVAAVEALAGAGSGSRAAEEALRALAEAARESLPHVLTITSALQPLMSSQDQEALIRRTFDAARESPEQQLRLGAVLIAHLNASGQIEECTRLIASLMARPEFAGWPERGEVILMKARNRELARDTEGAIAAYKEMLTQFPEDLTALNNLAWTMVTEANRPQEALQYAERARQLALVDPESTIGRNTKLAGLLDTVGWVYFKNQMIPEAIAALEEALISDPDLLPTYDHLAQVYLAAGRRADARTRYLAGIELARKLGEAGRPYVQILEEGLRKLP